MSEEKLSRRGFMERTVGTVGATLAARSILLDGETVEASPLPFGSRAAAPSDRVRFGMIGIGMRGAGLLGTSIKLPGVQCAAACDLSMKGAEPWLSRS